MDKEKIKKEAKQILDKFASALARVEKKAKGDFYVDREEFERSEGSGKECESDFKKNLLKNAPEADEDFVLTERGKWK